MPFAARQSTLERAVQAAIAATIVFAGLASGSIQSWIPAARLLRWAALLVLVALALAWAWDRRGRPAATPLVAAGAFVALASVSALWSVEPQTTVGHAAGIAVVLVAAAALAHASSHAPESAERVLAAVVFGAGVIVAGGLVLLAVDYDRAVAAATAALPARYQGLGGGPNTATMLLAVALAPALYLALAPGGLVRRALAALVALGSLASIVASGSRGALAAAFAGALVFAVLRTRGVRRAVGSAAIVVAVFGASLALSQIPDPAGPGAPAPDIAADPNPPPIAAAPPYVWVDTVLRLQDDVGHPPPGVRAKDEGRTLLGSSGRAEAWAGTVRQAADRPLTGYGFGTEDAVFVDRYVGFNSAVPENSYIGILLQLGAVGLAGLLAIAAALLVPLARRRVPDCVRPLAAASAGALASGLVLALFQSYLYAPGNNATAALWICAFLLASLVP